MKNALLLFTLFSFFACTPTEKGNEVFLFNNLSFNLAEGEKQADLNPTITDSYLFYFQNTDFQVPLFKSIKHEDYSIYLGTPYNTSIKRLLHLQLNGQSADLLEEQSDTLSYFYKQHRIDGAFVSEYSEEFDGNLIYFLAKTESKIISDSLFSKNVISTRFNQGK